jgi:RNA polymerase sigma factor (sigma-70 family)
MTILIHPAFEYDDDASWFTLYSWLKFQVRNWVYTSHTLRWQGEEEETIEDIVSEAIMHILDRIHKANSGEADPIKSLYGFARQVAHNYFIDLLRRDRKSLRLSQLTADGEDAAIKLFLVDIEEAVLKAVCDEQFFKLLGQQIVTLPKRQKEAVLRDHARLMENMVDPAPLLHAYQKVGIQLNDYCNYATLSLSEKRRHSALLHIAYKRLSRSPLLRQYRYGSARQSA